MYTSGLIQSNNFNKEINDSEPMLGRKEFHHLLVTIIDNVLNRTDNLWRQFHLTVLKIFIIQEEAWLGQLERPHQRS